MKNILIDAGPIIALYNPKDKYHKQINEFLLETNRDNIIVFETAWEDEWVFEFLIIEKTNQTAFRQFEKRIEVTDEHLYLVNWTDLTSSLQFKNTEIPDETNEDLKIKIPNGFYRVTVKQLFDSEDDDYDCENKVSYVVELMPDSSNPNIRTDKIIWTENFPNDDTIFLNDEPSELDDYLDQLLKKGKSNSDKAPL